MVMEVSHEEMTKNYKQLQMEYNDLKKQCSEISELRRQLADAKGLVSQFATNEAMVAYSVDNLVGTVGTLQEVLSAVQKTLTSVYNCSGNYPKKLEFLRSMGIVVRDQLPPPPVQQNPQRSSFS